eukprot:scaffold598_cov318-Pavlova_lutheri.AAC.10
MSLTLVKVFSTTNAATGCCVAAWMATAPPSDFPITTTRLGSTSFLPKTYAMAAPASCLRPASVGVPSDAP